MYCQQCNLRAATVRVRKEGKDKIVDYYLCENCANHNQNIYFGTHINISDILSGFITSQNGTINKNTKVLQCEVCGLTFTKFKETGKLGCQTCYEKFDEKLDPIIKRIHGDSKYKGKVPRKLNINIQKTNEIDKLQSMLKDSIREEYEKAAEIRDKIRELQSD